MNKFTYLDAWMLIAQGGWWRTSEVAKALSVPVETASHRLSNMAADGYLVKREIQVEKRAPSYSGSPERTEFAVMPECFIPRGAMAGKVVEALGGT